MAETPNAAPSPTPPAKAPDYAGVGCMLAWLIALLALAAVLITQLASAAEPDEADGAPDAKAATGQAAPAEPSRSGQAGSRRRDREARRRLETELATAQEQLKQLRLEAAGSGMPQLWQGKIERQARHVADLKRQLRER
ncbi:MAG: hypothetical protein AAF628_29625 [Planctomycetota bacterium]